MQIWDCTDAGEDFGTGVVDGGIGVEVLEWV